MTLKVIRRLQTFSNATYRTRVPHFTTFQLTACSRGPSATAGLLVHSELSMYGIICHLFRFTVYVIFYCDFTFITARRYASAVYAVVVCLSVCLCVSVCVCLSVTSRSSTKMARHRKTQTTPHDSPGTLCLLYTSDAADE